jgi:GntR family transcriptional regulator
VSRVARYHLESGPVPLHRQVYLDLVSSLDGGEWGPGDRLPTERELCGQYGCSLITVRRALDELAREGRLERTRGRGTFVKPSRITHDLTATRSFTDEMRRRGLQPSTRLVEARTVPAEEAVAGALELTPGSFVHRIERLRCASGVALLLERAHLPAERFPGLLELDFEAGSLYDALTGTYGIQLGETHETIEPVLTSAREARLLAERPRQPALLLVGTTFTKSGIPIEFTRTLVPGDRSRLYVESRGMRTPTLLPVRVAAGQQVAGSSP